MAQREASDNETIAEEWFSEADPRIAVDLRKALIGGTMAVLVALAGSWSVGRLYGAEGRLLLAAMLPTTRFLCSAMMTATATTRRRIKKTKTSTPTMLIQDPPTRGPPLASALCYTRLGIGPAQRPRASARIDGNGS
jgi:hypothetical protein